MNPADSHWTEKPLLGWVGLGFGLLVAGVIALLPVDAGGPLRLGLFIACAIPAVLAVALLWQLQQAHQTNIRSLQTMADRSRTVDRLLEFSQTVQGAGKPQQVFDCLAQYLHTELSLSGIVILSQDPQDIPGIRLETARPASFHNHGDAVEEMEMTLCPCFRQNLPRMFKPDASPVRCSIEQVLRLPSEHPAYCVPFNVGRKTVVLVHMLLSPGEVWTEEKRQLAQTYVNAASSSLIMLHHLSEAEKQSLTDSLTGLYNRGSLEQLLVREVALSERHGTPLSLVMIDMDHFKEINDRHGHAAGDHLLKAFADCVRITLRKTDMAFRYGGDEFVIALPQTPIHQAEQVVNKLRQAFGSVDFSDAIANLKHPPTLSIGVAQRSQADNTTTLSALLSAADTAMYEAKRSNRNCVRVYSAQAA